MNYCLFQGTFNPIHNAHLRIAQYVLDNSYADKIIFIPAYEPPHKDFDANKTIHRLNLVKIAVKDNPDFEVSDIEYKRGGTSFTYLTVKELYEKFKPEQRFKFIIGTDAFKKIETWYETDELKNFIDFIVFIRENNFDEDSIKYLKQKGYNYKIMSLNYQDISSTEIREYIKSGKSITGLVPQEVEEYIKKNDIYKYQ